MQPHGSPFAHRIAIAIAFVVAGCGSGEPRPQPPPLHAAPDAAVATGDDWFETPTTDGPRSLPARDGDPPCPKDRCWTAGPDGRPAACLLASGPIGHAGDPDNVSSGVCGSGGGQCSYCRCAAADTPIATPGGEVAIAELAPGDLVLSLHQGRLQAVPLVEVSRIAVDDHVMVTVTLDSGRRLSMSPLHPTADGRVFADLAAGDAQISAVALEPYAGAYTHDILPASDTGTYVAAGVLVGSTLFRPGK